MDTNNRYNPDIHHRRSVRLRNYDYSQAGLYFITLCVKNHECIFGHIVDCEGNVCLALTEIGNIVRREWLKTAELRPNVALHNFIVMPNHFHGILEITENTNDNYVLKNDDVGARRALPDNNNVLCGGAHVGARRALPVRETHGAHSPSVRARHALPLPTTSELSQSRFQNIGKNTMSSIIGAFKSAVTRNIRAEGYNFAWQRNLWEHVIRDNNDYARIDDYITNNPFRWRDDMFYNE